MTNVPNPGIVEHSEESNYIQVQQLYLELSICFKGTNGRQKTYEISHVYSIFISGFMCQTTVIFGITKDGSLY